MQNFVHTHSYWTILMSTMRTIKLKSSPLNSRDMVGPWWFENPKEIIFQKALEITCKYISFYPPAATMAHR